MVRNRKRKTDIGMHTEEKIKEGIDLIYEGQKIREVARIIDVPYTTLYRKPAFKRPDTILRRPNIYKLSIAINNATTCSNSTIKKPITILGTVKHHDIKIILPQPAFTGGTKRQQGVYKFDLDFSKIVLR
ncbi:hypothetical protein O0L34_g7337 [Tuta absoluta]|nr:hypothetical protein O0L34_g7337 [Tuta absoluta]